MRTHILLVLISLFTASTSFAQRPVAEISVSGDGFLYYGDLSRSQFGCSRDLKTGFGLSAKYYVSKTISVRANFYRGSLKGNDAQFSDEWRQKRAYEFSSPLSEASMIVEADLLGKEKFKSYSRPDRNYKRWSLYGFAGAGFAFLDASRNWNKLDRVYFGKDAVENIPEDSVNHPDKMTFVVPVGIGARYDISKTFSAFLEVGYRFTFTDNLDGYKYSVYSKKNDGYTVYSFGISYRFLKYRFDENQALFKNWYRE